MTKAEQAIKAMSASLMREHLELTVNVLFGLALIALVCMAFECFAVLPR